MMEQPEIINVKGGQEKPFEIEIIPIDKMWLIRESVPFISRRKTNETLTSFSFWIGKEAFPRNSISYRFIS
jgi:hypothetical protein